MRNIENNSEQLDKYLPWGKRVMAWSCVALTAALVPFSGELGLKALAEDYPKVQSFVPQAEHLHLRFDPEIIEGQPVEIQLAWRNIPAASRVSPQKLSLEWESKSYFGEIEKHKESLELGLGLAKRKVLFQSSGSQELLVKNEAGETLKSIKIETKPFPASVFPQNWDKYQELDQNPENFKILVNLFYDPKTAAHQRQHLQVIYQDQIIERLLVSSGAPGHDTPLGEFKVGTKEYYPRSSLYNNTPMPFWSAININGNNGEYGFHSLEGGAYLYLLGKPASHGCVRLSRKPSVETHPETGDQYWGDRGGARWIFDRVPQEAPVHIFSKALDSFSYEDYPAYLARMAKEFQEAQKVKKSDLG